jgi:hypothetical protein
MAQKKNYKQAHATIVEAPTQDIDVPSKTIGEEKKKDFKEQENCDNHDDHENEKNKISHSYFSSKIIGSFA